MSPSRLAVCLLVLTACTPATASADWLITPWAGLKFGGDTTIAGLDVAAGATKLTFGGSLTLLGDGVFGLEGDFGYTPHFFERSERTNVVRSHVITIVGSVIAAVPRRVSGDSLRPFVQAGVGLMPVSVDTTRDVLPVKSNMLTFSTGGGAIGPLSDRTSLRFDIRYFRNLTEDEEVLSIGPAHLSFWRLTVGVSFR